MKSTLACSIGGYNLEARFPVSCRSAPVSLFRAFAFSLLLCACCGEQSSAAATAIDEAAQWTVFEVSFTSASRYQNPFQDVTVTVEFTAPDEKTRTVDAYWDGESTWRVRFSPEQTGEWKYRTHASRSEDKGLEGQTGKFRCVPYKGGNSLYTHGRVRVSQNERYLEQADGTPFFWLSDTAWNGALKADHASWESYLSDRGKKKFTVVQFVTTQWIAAAGNAEARQAYEGRESITIDPIFFQWMDERVRSVNDHGLVAAPVLIWTAPWSPYSKFLNPGNALPDDQVIRLARYMVARYGAYQVIWILAGDGDYHGDEAERWKQIGRAVFGDNVSRLVTIHPTGHQWVGGDFGQEPWFSFIGYQSGHGDGPEDHKWIFQGPPALSWDVPPVHPIINLEPNYEDHVSYFSHRRFDAHAVRRAAYWSSLVSPTAGVTYGAHGIWGWDNHPAIPMNHLGSGIARPWFEALNLPGSTDMAHMMALFASLEWWKLRPDPALIANQPGDKDPSAFVAAAKAENNEWALLYFPVGMAITLKPDELPGSLLVRWFNPRSGKWGPATPLVSPNLMAPNSEDWVAWIGQKKTNSKSQRRGHSAPEEP